jgi:hypothetical protein
MPLTQERNAKILQLHQSGTPLDELASRFQVSAERVHQIINAAKQEETRKSRVQFLREQIRLVDDLDHTWDVKALVEVLCLPKRVHNGLVQHFDNEKRNQLSLREFMEIAVTEKATDALSLYKGSPVHCLPCIGVNGFRDILAALTSLDMGRTCNREWKRRLGILEKHGWLKAGISFSTLERDWLKTVPVESLL